MDTFDYMNGREGRRIVTGENMITLADRLDSVDNNSPKNSEAVRVYQKFLFYEKYGVQSADSSNSQS